MQICWRKKNVSWPHTRLHSQQCAAIYERSWPFFRCWSEKETHESRLWGATEQEARQGQNLRGDLLILNKITSLIPFLCARLTNCNDLEQVFVYDCPLSSKYNCNCPAKGSLTSLCNSMFLPDLIRRHNDPADDFHLDFHKMVCIAFKTDRHRRRYA